MATARLHGRVPQLSAYYRQCLSRSSAPRRTFVASPPRMVQKSKVSVSANNNEDEVVQSATGLVDRGRWSLCNDGAGLERQFKFKTFKATWAFMCDVADECKKQKHHPEWTNVFNQTHVKWTTHSPKGMSTKDTYMARFCDEAAKRHGEQPMEPSAAKLETREVEGAADCCGPKK